MTISKKASFIVLFSITLSTNVTVLSNDAFQRDLEANLKGLKEYSQVMLDYVPADIKQIAGVATIGLGGAFFIGKIAKNAAVTALYCGGLLIAGSISNHLLEGSEIKKTFLDTVSPLTTSWEIIVNSAKPTKELPKE
jgi:hypothetical protein